MRETVKKSIDLIDRVAHFSGFHNLSLRVQDADMVRRVTKVHPYIKFCAILPHGWSPFSCPIRGGLVSEGDSITPLRRPAFSYHLRETVFWFSQMGLVGRKGKRKPTA
jgi:hypothetical protein